MPEKTSAREEKGQRREKKGQRREVPEKTAAGLSVVWAWAWAWAWAYREHLVAGVLLVDKDEAVALLVPDTEELEQPVHLALLWTHLDHLLHIVVYSLHKRRLK